MESVKNVASYIAQRYKQEFGELICEMKLHKLLYLTQRECIIRFNEPMFAEPFIAWKYGPVIPLIRDMYSSGAIYKDVDLSWADKYKSVFDYVFSNYALKDAWSLSRLTHGETSWINARKGLAPNQNGSTQLSLDDIRDDANRIKMRRYILEGFSA